MTKKITEAQIKQTALKNDIEYAVLRAILEVECKGSGFLHNGTPTILFERHVFWRQLGKIDFYSVRKKMQSQRPDLCNRRPTQPGGYGYGSEQPERLDQAVNLIYEVLPDCDKKTYNKVRECALKSCSWGLGQIMGFNYNKAGFDNLQDFVNAMYSDEQNQLDAVVNLLTAWGLKDEMKRKDFTAIAKAWNGSHYWKHDYHIKLRNNYLRYA